MIKVYNVEGDTRGEALDKVPLKIKGDATKSYKKWLSEQDEGTDNQIFMEEYLKAHGCKEGEGYVITKVAAIPSNLQRPYTIQNVAKTEKRKYKTTYVLKDGDNIVATIIGTEADAKRKARYLFKTGKCKTNLDCVIMKSVISGQPLAFKAIYLKSKKARKGQYIVFGKE